MNWCDRRTAMILEKFSKASCETCGFRDVCKAFAEGYVCEAWDAHAETQTRRNEIKAAEAAGGKE